MHEFTPTHDLQLYCVSCRAQPSGNAARRAHGTEVSVAAAVGQAWLLDLPEPVLRRHVRVAVPFEWGYSKNRAWRHAQGRTYANASTTALRGALTMQIRALGGPWYEGPVWLDILVQKPSMQGDAINVVDVVADAVKDAIGVDDNWYGIRRLAWQVVRRGPLMYVGIGQEVQGHHRCCSSCGQVKSLDQFNRSTRDRLGTTTRCRACMAAGRALSRRSVRL